MHLEGAGARLRQLLVPHAPPSKGFQTRWMLPEMTTVRFRFQTLKTTVKKGGS